MKNTARNRRFLKIKTPSEMEILFGIRGEKLPAPKIFRDKKEPGERGAKYKKDFSNEED